MVEPWSHNNDQLWEESGGTSVDRRHEEATKEFPNQETVAKRHKKLFQIFFCLSIAFLAVGALGFRKIIPTNRTIATISLVGGGLCLTDSLLKCAQAVAHHKKALVMKNAQTNPKITLKDTLLYTLGLRGPEIAKVSGQN